MALTNHEMLLSVIVINQMVFILGWPGRLPAGVHRMLALVQHSHSGHVTTMGASDWLFEDPDDGRCALLGGKAPAGPLPGICHHECEG